MDIKSVSEGESVIGDDVRNAVNVLLGLLPSGPEREKIAGRVADMLVGERKKHNFLMPCAQAQISSVSGKGVFATEDILKGQKIAMFGGNVTHISDWLELPEEVRVGHIMIGAEFTIGSTDTRDVDDGDFFNHSCNPNCGVQGHLELSAMKDIGSGDELSFDYGTVVGGVDITLLGKSDILDEEGRVILIEKCQCGGTNCRGRVTGDDWKTLAKNPLYEGFFSYHIRKLITSM